VQDRLVYCWDTWGITEACFEGDSAQVSAVFRRLLRGEVGNLTRRGTPLTDTNHKLADKMTPEERIPQVVLFVVPFGADVAMLEVVKRHARVAREEELRPLVVFTKVGGESPRP
jgi:hypothetical protein